jgi:hypothetical protein
VTSWVRSNQAAAGRFEQSTPLLVVDRCGSLRSPICAMAECRKGTIAATSASDATLPLFTILCESSRRQQLDHHASGSLKAGAGDETVVDFDHRAVR